MNDDTKEAFPDIISTSGGVRLADRTPFPFLVCSVLTNLIRSFSGKGKFDCTSIIGGLLLPGVFTLLLFESEEARGKFFKMN